MAEKMPGARPGPRLEDTSASALNALQSRLREIVSASEGEFQSATEQDIAQAAFYLALSAEKARMPYTPEYIAVLPAVDEAEFKSVLARRLSGRTGESARMHVQDTGGDVIASVSGVTEALGVTKEERDAR